MLHDDKSQLVTALGKGLEELLQSRQATGGGAQGDHQWRLLGYDLLTRGWFANCSCMAIIT